MSKSKYEPFGEDVKAEMLRCIGYDIKLVHRDKRFRYFKATQNKRVVRSSTKMWQMLCRCGYAELICTQKSSVMGILFNVYALTEKGIGWLGRQMKWRMGLKLIPPTIIGLDYKEEKVC